MQDWWKCNIQTPFIQLAGRAEENVRDTKAYLNMLVLCTTGKTTDRSSFI